MEKTSAARGLRLQKTRRDVIPASALLDRAERRPRAAARNPPRANPLDARRGIGRDGVLAPSTRAEASVLMVA